MNRKIFGMPIAGILTAAAGVIVGSFVLTWVWPRISGWISSLKSKFTGPSTGTNF